MNAWLREDGKAGVGRDRMVGDKAAHLLSLPRITPTPSSRTTVRHWTALPGFALQRSDKLLQDAQMTAAAAEATSFPGRPESPLPPSLTDAAPARQTNASVKQSIEPRLTYIPSDSATRSAVHSSPTTSRHRRADASRQIRRHRTAPASSAAGHRAAAPCRARRGTASGSPSCSSGSL